MKSVRVFYIFILILFAGVSFNGCKDNSVSTPVATSLSPAASTFQGDYAYEWTDVTYRIISDQQPNPPKALRSLSYIATAIYEAVAPGIPNSRSLSGQFRDMPTMPAASSDSVYDWPSVITGAVSTLMPKVFDTLYVSSLSLMNSTYTSEYNARVIAVGQTIVDRSIRHGVDIGNTIIAWSRTDQYI